MSKTNTDESCQTKLSSVPSVRFTSLDSFDRFRFHSCQQPEKNTKRSPNKIPVLFLCPTEFMNFIFLNQKNDHFPTPPTPRTKPGCFPQGTTSTTRNDRATSACAAPYLASTEAARGQPGPGSAGWTKGQAWFFTVNSTSSGWWFFTNPFEKICAS